MKLPEPRNPDRPYAICVVCMGNICRSPIGEVVLRSRLDDAGLGELVVVDSAGLGGWHAGDQMDRRSRDVLVEAGFGRTTEHRARKFRESWFESRDLILGMDDSNVAGLRKLAPSQHDRDRIGLFGSFGHAGEVPDPYYGGRGDFENVLQLVIKASDALIGKLGSALGRGGTRGNITNQTKGQSVTD